MLSKLTYSLVIGLFVFGFAFLVQPQSATAGAGAGPTGLGCCINNGGNCNPGCGGLGDSCFRNFDEQGNGPCPTNRNGMSCGGIDASGDEVGCFVEGEICFQVTENTGECRPPGDSPDCEVATDCPLSEDPECFDRVCNSGSCGFVATGAEGCDPEPPSDPAVIVPTMGQWGMLLAAIVLGAFAIIRIRSIKDSELS